MNEAATRLKINKLLEAAGRRLITLSNGNLRYLRDLRPGALSVEHSQYTEDT